MSMEPKPTDLRSDPDSRTRAGAAKPAIPSGSGAAGATTHPDHVFREFVERANQAIIVAQDGKLRYANPCAAGMLRTPPGELIAKDFVNFIHPDDRALVADRHERRLRGEALPATYDFRVVDGTGHTRWVQISVATIPWEGRAATLSFLTDITDRKYAEESARWERERAEAFLDIVGVIVVAIAPDQSVLLINKKGCEVLGYTREEITGKNWFETSLPERLRVDFKKAFADLMTGNLQPWEYVENPVCSKAGEERLIGWHNTIIRDDAGVIVASLSSGEDITERRLSESALRESEERYRRITEAITDYIYTVRIQDGKPVETRHGPGCVAVTGYTTDEFVADPYLWITMVAPEDREAVRDHARRVIAGEQVPALEHRIVRRDGCVRWVRNTPVLRRNAQGVPQAYDGLVQDVTNRKQAEEEARVALGKALQKEAETRALFEAATAVMEFDEFAVAARRIFDACCKVTGAVSGYVALLNESKQENEVLFLESGGLPCSVSPDLPMPVRGLRAQAYTMGTAVYSNDFMHSEWARFMPRGHVGLRNVMFAPLKIEGKVIGIMGLANKPVDFTDEDARLAAVFGDLAAIALRRVRLDEALATEYQRTKEILFSIPAGLFIYQYVPPDRLILEYGNPEARTLTGFDPQAWIGREFNEIWPNARESGITDKYLQVVHSGRNAEMHDVQYADDRVSGAYRIRVFNIPGNRLGVAFENITNIKAAEDALRRSEESHRALIAGLPDIIMRFDRDGRHLFVSENVTEIVDLTPEQFIGKTHRELGFPEDLCVTWESAIRRIFDDGSPSEMEFTFQAKRGPTIFNWRLVPELDSRGRTLSVLTIARDVTRHRLTENRFRAFFSQISQLAYMISTDGAIIDVNEAALARLGYERSELVGKPLSMIYAEESLERAKLLFQEWKRTGLLQNEEIVVKTKSGDRRTVLLNVSAVRDESGAIIHSVSLQTDITELKKMQDEIQRNQKLESLGILAGGIAHDFNNLLGGLFGYIDLARESAQRGNVQQAVGNLDKVISVFDRARSLTQQLLTFSKGGAPVRKVQDLVAVVRRTTDFSLTGSSVTPVYRMSEEKFFCDIDENQISQVLENLAVNARQAMPLGGTLTVTLERADPAHVPVLLAAGPYVHLSCRDTGTGISPEHLSRIFDPFFTTKQQGSGLGLATSFSIIKRHGGTMEVESELGKGATFHIWLPASVEQTVAQPRETTRTADHAGSGRVLIMDDEEFMLDIASTILGGMGYVSSTARDSSSAVALMKEAHAAGRPFVAAILDLTIPGGKGGRETVAPMREIDSGIKIIASSGYADDPVMADPRAYGFDATLVKPYRKAHLARVMDAITPGSG